MSMQMAKRVSLSQPRDLNRSPHEIEPLDSHCTLPRDDRTRRSEMTERTPPASGRPMNITCPCDLTALVDLQRSNEPVLRIKEQSDVPDADRMHHLGVRSSARPSKPHCDWTHRDADLTLLRAASDHFQ
jgi:hypothetical protein